MSHKVDLYRVQPWPIARNCGGWLAVTPRGWPLSIGVIAETEEAVKEKFAASLVRWFQRKSNSVTYRCKCCSPTWWNVPISRRLSRLQADSTVLEWLLPSTY